MTEPDQWRSQASQLLRALETPGSALDATRTEAVGQILGNARQLRFVLYVIENHPLTLSEAANGASLSLPYASACLEVAEHAGLLVSGRSGRTRVIDVAGDSAIASLLELLVSAASPPLHSPAGVLLWQCETHFGGESAGALLQLALDRGWIVSMHNDRLAATSKLQRLLRLTSMGVAKLPTGRTCSNRDHRTPHLGGALGAVLGDLAIEQGWITNIGSRWLVSPGSGLSRRLQGRLEARHRQ